MNAILAIASVVLPLLPLVLFPTRFIGRGPLPTILGAGLLVGMMMVLYFGLSALTADTGSSPGDLAGLPSVSDADVSALEKLLK